MDFLSIDPGKSGAVVVWEDDVPIHWRQLDVQTRFFDVPTIDMINELYELWYIDEVVIEQLMDRNIRGQSSIANNTTAVNYGIHIGAAMSYHKPVIAYTASAWKTKLDLTKDKETSLDMARNLYPMCEDDLKLKKNHDLAEALLIGHYHLIKKEDEI